MLRSLGMSRMGAATVLGVLTMAINPALGALGASATISSTPNGANFDYTVKVTDTGTTPIGTFWFAWTPPDAPFEYDFLPSTPSTASQPSGWAGIISAGFPGTSIEYYNVSGSAIGVGDTGTFHFTTADSPTDLQGTSLGFPITESFIYEGAPEEGAFAEVDPVFTVPEPSSFALAAIGAACLMRRRRSKAIA